MNIVILALANTLGSEVPGTPYLMVDEKWLQGSGEYDG